MIDPRHYGCAPGKEQSSEFFIQTKQYTELVLMCWYWGRLSFWEKQTQNKQNIFILQFCANKKHLLVGRKQ